LFESSREVPGLVLLKPHFLYTFGKTLRLRKEVDSVLREEEWRMLEGKAMIEDTDMPVKMQVQAMASASQALDLYDVFDCRSIAAHIKKVLSLSLSLKDIEN
jgi:hypothetical protein